MLKFTPILLCLLMTTYAAEVSNSYALLEKHGAFKPEFKTEPVQNHSITKKESKMETDDHPVFRPDDGKAQGRATMEMVKDDSVKHDMLADQPAPSEAEVNRVDHMVVPNYAYVPAVEVSYPDIPYAPGYGYDPNYAPSNYEYNNGLSYTIEDEPTAFSMLWSQVPDSRTMVGFVGRTLAWMFHSFFVLLLGSLLTVGVCSYTNLCTLTFHGVGPIHEEMRSLMTPERLEKIGHAADFVKSAIDKYQKIQNTNDNPRKRKSMFA